jgi:V-type H+-transporting ATPase proteolipid subunit
LGGAYGTAKAGLGICSISVLRPDLIIKSVIPVVLAGILGLYGLIVAVIILGNINSQDYKYFKAYSHLGAGLCCGLSSLAAGLAIGIVGDAGSLSSHKVSEPTPNRRDSSQA